MGNSKTLLAVLRGDRARTPDAKTRLQSLLENHVDAIFETDRDGICCSANQRACDLTGYSLTDLIGKTSASFVPDDQLPAVRRQRERVYRGETAEYHTILMCRNGRRVPVRVTAIPVFVDALVVTMYSIVRDITAEREATTQLIEYTDRIRALNAVSVSTGATAHQHMMDILICGTQLLGLDCAIVCKRSSDAFEITYTAGTEAPEIGRRWLVAAATSVLPDDAALDRSIVRETQWRTFIGGAVIVAGVPYGTIAFGGAISRSVPSGKYDPDLVDSIAAVAGFAVERDLHEAHLRTLAFHDTLTGLPNRALLLQRLTERLANARSTGCGVAVHFIDLDGFKAINDTHGHAAGDDVLRTVARRLERTIRENDTIARLGGDEFVVVQKLV